MRIVIQAVEKQREPWIGVGDWQFEGDVLYVRVLKMGDERFEAMVAIHECVEALLCRNDGVPEKRVDDFDAMYERARTAVEKGIVTHKHPDPTNPGIHSEILANPLAEPGDSRFSPYATQHGWATAVERILAGAFGVSWAEYDETVQAVSDLAPDE